MNKEKIKYYLDQLKKQIKGNGRDVVGAETIIYILEALLEEEELPISYYILPTKNPSETITMNT